MSFTSGSLTDSHLGLSPHDLVSLSQWQCDGIKADLRRLSQSENSEFGRGFFSAGADPVFGQWGGAACEPESCDVAMGVAQVKQAMCGQGQGPQKLLGF